MSRVETMFGPRESWGRGDEMKTVRERAAAAGQKNVGTGVPDSPAGARRSKGSECPDASGEVAAPPQSAKLTAPPHRAQGSHGDDREGRPYAAQGGAREAKKAGFNKGNFPGISGFVSIKCQECGKVHNTCLREKRTIFNCKVCGHPNSLEGLRNLHFRCPRCSFTGCYRTNRVEKEIVFECLGCSEIVPMVKIRRGNYVPATETATPPCQEELR